MSARPPPMKFIYRNIAQFCINSPNGLSHCAVVWTEFPVYRSYGNLIVSYRRYFAIMACCTACPPEAWRVTLPVHVQSTV